MTAKISAVVRADNGGLGTLSRMFAEYLGFHRTVSFSRHEGEHHPRRFGSGDRHAESGLTPELIEWLCQGADVLLTFECWYGDHVPAMARALGCKTAMMPMYECCPQRGGGLEETDLAICPSLLDLEEMWAMTPGLNDAVKTFLPVPFDTARIPFRRRQRAEIFVVHQGHGGIDDRNATQQVLDAWRHVRSPAQLVVKRQPSAPAIRVPPERRIVVVERDVADYWDLWGGAGDVFLHPHRWDGLSLPIQEACAAGLPVMTTRYWPFCDSGEWWSSGVVSGCTSHHSPLTIHQAGWLPPTSQRLAIDPVATRRRRICREFTSHETTPQAIARAVDAVYGHDISRASADVRACAENNSWTVLAPVYRQWFDDLAAGGAIAEVYHET